MDSGSFSCRPLRSAVSSGRLVIRVVFQLFGDTCGHAHFMLGPRFSCFSLSSNLRALIGFDMFRLVLATFHLRCCSLINPFLIYSFISSYNFRSKRRNIGYVRRNSENTVVLGSRRTPPEFANRRVAYRNHNVDHNRHLYRGYRRTSNESLRLLSASLNSSFSKRGTLSAEMFFSRRRRSAG